MAAARTPYFQILSFNVNAWNNAPLLLPKAIKIHVKTTDSDWFVDLLTIEEV